MPFWGGISKKSRKKAAFFKKFSPKVLINSEKNGILVCADYFTVEHKHFERIKEP